jgi:DNA-binding XRE family transcriptional regulator
MEGFFLMRTLPKRPAHRPSDYRQEYARIAYHHALLGATDADMAEAFNVSEVTINAWKKKHPDFLKSLKRGKLAADAKVAECLYLCATGFNAPAVKIFIHNGKIVEHKYTEHIPPDVTAQIFWLKNRRPAQFRTKPEVALTVNNGEVVDLSKPPEEWGQAEIIAELRRRGELPEPPCKTTVACGS